mmetsp:Transcript_39141/g.124592  ORF Transcript_39141/g.124592 Transcript_39141/m.124592 type:complete len:200 (+) Transcript_39141:1041-1640(+)
MRCPRSARWDPAPGSNPGRVRWARSRSPSPPRLQGLRSALWRPWWPAGRSWSGGARFSRWGCLIRVRCAPTNATRGWRATCPRAFTREVGAWGSVLPQPVRAPPRGCVARWTKRRQRRQVLQPRPGRPPRAWPRSTEPWGGPAAAAPRRARRAAPLPSRSRTHARAHWRTALSSPSSCNTSNARVSSPRSTPPSPRPRA